MREAVWAAAPRSACLFSSSVRLPGKAVGVLHHRRLCRGSRERACFVLSRGHGKRLAVAASILPCVLDHYVDPRCASQPARGERGASPDDRAASRLYFLAVTSITQASAKASTSRGEAYSVFSEFAELACDRGFETLSISARTKRSTTVGRFSSSHVLSIGSSISRVKSFKRAVTVNHNGLFERLEHGMGGVHLG
jgi:hypothetical protein